MTADVVLVEEEIRAPFGGQEERILVSLRLWKGEATTARRVRVPKSPQPLHPHPLYLGATHRRTKLKLEDIRVSRLRLVVVVVLSLLQLLLLVIAAAACLESKQDSAVVPSNLMMNPKQSK
jgi:hypothetical protein